MDKRKITSEDFKQNKLLIAVTIILAFLAYISKLIPPQNYNVGSMFLLFAIEFPLTAWWLMAFWNRILSKIVNVPTISYGVAVILTAAMYYVF